MAIDASIALKGQVPKIDLPGILGQVQTIRSGQATEQISRAQLPGVQAESANKDREERARKFIEANKGKFSRLDPKTGTRKFDERALANALGEQGFGEFSQTFFAKAAANEASDLGNAKTEQELGEKKMAFAKNRAQDAANLIRTLPEAERPAQIKKWREGTRSTVGEYADVVFDEFFGPEIAPMVNRPALVSQATITPEQQVANDLTRNAQRQTDVGLGLQGEQLAQSGAAGGIGAAERNAKSPISAAYRQQAAAQGIIVPPNATAAQVRVLPGFREVIESQIPSAESRTRLQVEAGDITANAGAITAASNVARQLATEYGRPGSITRKAWNALVEQSPQYAEVQGSIDAYNAANPGAKLDILDGFSAIQRRLDIYAKELNKKAGVRSQVSQSPTMKPPAAAEPAAPAAAPNFKAGDKAVINGRRMEFLGGNPKVQRNWRAL